jgi:hypothetical protein
VVGADCVAWLIPRLVLGSILVFVGIGLAAVHVASGFHDLGNDALGYVDAGTRVREGAQLYLPAVGGDPDIVPYRYAPWFAWLWAPLSLLPRDALAISWCVAMLAASGWALWLIARMRTWTALAVVVFFGPLLLYAALAGNVQPLMVAVLMHNVERRYLGPLSIAAAASLKAFPALFAIVYLARQEWDRFALAVVASLVLAAPMLLYDLSDYTTSPGFSLTASVWAPLLYAVLAVSALIGAALMSRTRFRWLAAGAAVTLTMTRLLWYDLTFLLVGVAPLGNRHRPGSTVDRPQRAT